MSKPPPLNASGEPRAFFGRRSGKRLHPGQDLVLQDALPRLSLTLPETGPLNPRTLFPKARRFALEIGYGGGEHLIREALLHPATGYVGAEVFSGGVAKLVQAIELEQVDNIRLYTEDALKLLQKLPQASLHDVFLLYPDPWPKTRHHKRRFVSPVTLAELARVLRPGGTLWFATDIPDYADWTLAHIVRQPLFDFAPARPGIWHEPFPGWIPTRYEIKARKEGRTESFYFAFTRT